MKARKAMIAMTMAAMVAVMTACGGSSQSQSQPAAAQETQTEKEAQEAETQPAASETEAAATIKEIESGMLEGPVILTSIGQSADVDIVNTLCTKAGVELEKNNNITADELPADCKTLILAVGGSSKGLGAAGIDADQELVRANALFEKAKGQGTKILAMHTGGSARRGTLSDFFIAPSFEAADVAIVVSEGDQDGLMKGILEKNAAAASYVDQIADCVASLTTLFGK